MSTRSLKSHSKRDRIVKHQEKSIRIYEMEIRNFCEKSIVEKEKQIIALMEKMVLLMKKLKKRLTCIRNQKLMLKNARKPSLCERLKYLRMVQDFLNDYIQIRSFDIKVSVCKRHVKLFSQTLYFSRNI